MNLIWGVCGYFKSGRNKIYKELPFIQQGAQFQNLFFSQLSKPLQSMYAQFIFVQIWGTEFVSYSLYSGKGLSSSRLRSPATFPSPGVSSFSVPPGSGCGEPALAYTLAPRPRTLSLDCCPLPGDGYLKLSFGNAAWQSVFQY